MLRDERREFIIKIVGERGFVKNLTLAEMTESTIQTIITDVSELNELGKIIKVYGGAKAVSSEKTFSEPFEEEKLSLNLEAKAQIASTAAQQISDDDLVFIDTGTSTGYMVKNIILNKNAHYVTNGYSIAKHLMEQGLKVLIVGGEIIPSTHAIVGELAIKFLDNFNFTKSFLGMNSLEASYLYTTNVAEGVIKEKVIYNSEQTFILMDSSKFDQKNKIKVNWTGKKVALISDQIPKDFTGEIILAK